MKKTRVFFIAVFSLTQFAEGMDYWNGFKGWVSSFLPSQQGQASIPAVRENPVVPAVNIKKRERDPEVVDLTDDSNDDQLGTKRPAGFDRIQFNKGLSQNNNWECGYYSLFHCFALKDKVSLSQGEYDNLRGRFKDFKSKKGIVFQESFSQEKKLSNCFLQDLIESVNLSECLGVITSTTFYEKLPIDLSVIRCINCIVRDRQPVWFIVGDNAHWVCLECRPTQEGSCDYFCYDSIPGYAQSVPRFREFFKKIMDLCEGVIVLPPADHYLEILRKLRRMIAENQGNDLGLLEQEALDNGFTPETFSLLVRYVKNKVSPSTSSSSHDVIDLE